MRKILPIITALAVAFSLCIFPASAADDDFVFVPFSPDYVDLFEVNGSYFGNGRFSVDVADSDVYACLIAYSASIYGGLVVSRDSDAYIYSYNGYGTTTTRRFLSSSSSYSDVYYFAAQTVSSDYVTPVVGVPVYESVDAALSAFSTWTPPAPDPVPQTITIPAGYVLYFRASSDVTAGVTTNFAASNVSAFGSFDNTKFTQTYGTASALPAPGTSGDWHTGSRFTWLLDGGFLGFGSSFMTAKDFDSSNDYHYIYNPLMSLFTSNSIPIYNQSLRVNFTTAGVSELYLIPLSSGGVTGDFSGFSSNTSETLPVLQVNVGTDGVISTTDVTTGDIIAPVAGGDNSQYYYDSSDPSAQYQGLFSQFVNELNTIFGSVIGAFQTLINGASSFISSLGELFSWLPSEIVTFLTSSLIVIVIAGVIKAVLP